MLVDDIQNVIRKQQLVYDMRDLLIMLPLFHVFLGRGFSITLNLGRSQEARIDKND